jgi:hypothetical protein
LLGRCEPHANTWNATDLPADDETPRDDADLVIRTRDVSAIDKDLDRTTKIRVGVEELILE